MAAHCSGRSPTTQGLDAVAVDEAGHFHAGVLRQIGNQTGIEHITVNSIGGIVHDRLDDIRCKLVGLGMFDMGILQQTIPHFPPALDLFHTAAGILIQRNFVPLDQLGILVLDEIGGVFRGMLAGFGDIIAELLHNLQTHQIVSILVVLR